MRQAWRNMASPSAPVIAEDDRGVGALEVLAEQGLALDEREPAQILVADVDQVEGVEACCSAPSSEAAASPSRTILVNGRAIRAAVIATNSADQFRPWRLDSRTSSPAFSATMRKPSCFSSWIQPSPIGTFAESTG